MKILKLKRYLFPLLFAELFVGGMLFCLIRHGAVENYMSMLFPGALLSILLFFAAWKLDGNRSFAGYSILLLNLGIMFQAILGEKDAGHLERLYFVTPVIALFGAGFVVFMILEADHFRRKYPQILIFSSVTIIYIGLLCFGVEVGGVKAWFEIGAFRFQATDITKLLTVVSWGITLRDSGLPERSKVRNCLLLLGINVVSLAGINEFGTLLVLAVTLVLMFFLYLRQWRVTVILTAVMFLGAGAGCLLVGKIRERITIWLYPERDPYGAGYQLLESLKSIRLGGLFGDYHYGVKIPVPDSDFAFSSLVNCMGLIIGLFLIFGYALFFRAGMNGREDREGAVGTGLLISIMVTTLLSLSGSIGLLPTVGLPMAFLSYGGTNLVYVLLTVIYIIFTQSAGYENIIQNAVLVVGRRARVRAVRRGEFE